MRHDAELVEGSLYNYLGHFAQDHFLRRGHNDAGAFVTSSEGEGLAWNSDAVSYGENDPRFGAKGISGSEDRNSIYPYDQGASMRAKKGRDI